MAEVADFSGGFIFRGSVFSGLDWVFDLFGIGGIDAASRFAARWERVPNARWVGALSSRWLGREGRFLAEFIRERKAQILTVNETRRKTPPTRRVTLHMTGHLVA